MTATFAARASPTSFFIAGSAATQRGRLPQVWFIKSPIISAVVFGSTVTALISGAAGVFTLGRHLVEIVGDVELGEIAGQNPLCGLDQGNVGETFFPDLRQEHLRPRDRP